MIRFAENLNKMITAGLGGALEAPSTEVAVGHCIRYLESSGAVASFETNIAAPIRSLRVDMLPIQNLHGYDSPWPAGGGKNKLNVDAISHTDGMIVNNGSLVVTAPSGRDNVSSVESLSDFADLVVGQQYILTFTTTYSGGNYIYLRGTGEAWTNGETKTITQAMLDGKVSFYSGVGGTATISSLMIRSSSVSDATYSPYSNICPITGRESVTVWRKASYDPSADPTLTIPLGQTVYGGTLDVSTGKLAVTHGEIASYNGEVLTGEWTSDRDVYAAGTTPTIGAQVVYVLDTPQTIDLDPQQITTLKGTNNVWSNSGDVTLEYPYYEETEGY